MKRFASKITRLNVALVFLLLAAILAATYYFYPYSDRFNTDFDVNFNGKVIVVGAGSAGLTAAFLLEQQGADVQIIEAQDVYGGRMRESEDFADFPIDLGAEWIHEDPSVLEEIAGINGGTANVETITYSPREVFEWDSEELSQVNRALTYLYSEYKFKDTTWFDFFEQNIVPPIRDKIVLGEPVSSIDYSGDKVTVSTVDNTTFQPANTYEADRVIVTVPITVLQNNYISFTPALDEDRVEAINNVKVPDGIKVFFEFSEKFYPDMLTFTEYNDDAVGEDKLFYDAAFGKDSDRNILALFSVGPSADELVGLSDEELIQQLLGELDEIYDGAASRSYVKHIVQNWTSTRFIEGAYSTEFTAEREATIEAIAAPLSDKVFFAGEALSINNQSTVPGAAETGFEAAKLVLTQP